MTARRSDAERLADCLSRHRELARQLADIGFIRSGSLVRRYTRCANPNCRCRADPPRPHGPYWQWSARVDGKTVTRRLTDAQAVRYAEWIANGRQLRQILAQMHRISEEASTLTVDIEDQPTPADRRVAGRSDETPGATT